MKSLKTLAIVAATALIAASPAMAQNYGHGGYRGGNGNWLVPALITGAIVYGVTQANQPVHAQPQPVYVQPPQPVYVERPVEYVERTVWNSYCGCYRRVLVPIQ